MKVIDNLIPWRQVGSWSSLELIEMREGCTLKIKHWSQHIKSLIALAVLIPSAGAAIGFSYNITAGLGLLGISLVAVFLVLAGSISALDGQFLLSIDQKSGELDIGNQLCASAPEIHEIYYDGPRFQASYVVVLCPAGKFVPFSINESKPNGSLLERFCDKNRIHYRYHCVTEKEELRSVYESILV